MNNIQEIRKALEILKPNGLVELRAFSKQNLCGYFLDRDIMLKSIEQYPSECFYMVMNEINPACHAKRASEKIIQSKSGDTTSDKDITERKWILVDADPVRTTGVSSTDGEKAKAKETIGKVFNYLKNVGFSEPIVADSGNGYHLLYSIKSEICQDGEWPADRVTDTIKDFLNVLDMLFSDDSVGIDTSVFNASRITKLYGCMANKGANTKDRPHRQSRILRVPDEIKPTSMILIRSVADQLPKPEAPTYRNNYNVRFDLQNFISSHGLPVTKISNWAHGTKYILEYCLFDSNHKTPDACIIQLENGAIDYKCFHNSCQGRTWRDVRLMYEPSAYDRQYEPKQSKVGITREQLIGKVENEPVKGTSMKRLSDIQSRNRNQIVSIKSGLYGIDNATLGHNKGEFSVWSGLNGSGKSTVLSQIALGNLNEGYNVAIFSGELRNSRLKEWLCLQAAGRQYTKKSKYGEAYYTPHDIVEKICSWCGDKLWIYDNDFGVKVDTIISAFKAHIEAHKTDVVIIDNLMSLDTYSLQGDKLERQTMIALTMADMAKKYDVHVHFVCHPRKPSGFLRKSDISGTADITNSCDNVFLVHRVNNDFKRFAKDFFGEGRAKEYFDYSNVIEVAKNRDLGIEDYLTGFYFEKESKRFLNHPHENIMFGWNDNMLESVKADDTDEWFPVELWEGAPWK